MGGATYWGNSEGRNDETTTPAIRSGESCYPGKQGTKPMSADDTKVPDEKKKY